MQRCKVEFEDHTTCDIVASTTDQQGRPVCIDHAPRCKVCQQPLLTPAPDGVHQGCFIVEGFKVMTQVMHRERRKNIGLEASERAENATCR